MDDMKLDFPGLLKEPLPSGNTRYRVRVEGRKRQRVTLLVTPDHPQFREHYLAARRGVQLKPQAEPDQAHIRGSLGWLITRHLAALGREVDANLKSPKTLQKRTHLLTSLAGRWGEFAMEMPRAQVIRIQDELAATPAWADSMVEAIRVMYRWALDRDLVTVNPALGVAKIDKGRGGATAWSIDDLATFRQHHPPGTMAHLALTLLVFTACRIGDARILGRGHEFRDQGVDMIGWTPAKKGSARVEIPMMPQLFAATRAMVLQGPTYLLTERGQTFKSADVMSATFRRWCQEAGLLNRSAHGIRKAAGHLLASAGCSQYHIMVIHGHTQARTSEIYTKGVERRRLARDAMAALRGLDW